jgi:hypothetical protein
MGELYRRIGWMGLLAGLGVIGEASASAASPRTVVELYTSQGCSSCPPADALAGRLRTDPAVLVLSFHVDYWDNQGWKDSFSSPVSTARQYAYARAAHQASVFTPQMILNGGQSLVGSSESAILRAIATAKAGELPVRAELLQQPGGTLALDLTGPELTGDVWEVRYMRSAITRIAAGENGGRTLETYNNVTHLEHLGLYKPGTRVLGPLRPPVDGIAILVQARGLGRMLGAVAFESSERRDSSAR